MLTMNDKELTFDERLKNLTETVGPEVEVNRFREMIKSHVWKFATTYADFCPHEYTVRANGWSHDDMQFFAHHIWLYGMDACYGKQEPKRYWFNHDDGYYYFIFQEDTDAEGNMTPACTLINRAKMVNFEFWVEEDLLGRIVRCKVKPGAAKREKEEREAKGLVGAMT